MYYSENTGRIEKGYQKKPEKIIVIGKLAGQVKKAERIKKLSPAAIGLIGALILAVPAEIASAPVTGGASLAFLAVQVATATTEISIPISVILLISGVGLTFISILFDEYSYLVISREKIVFERKRKEKES